MTKTLQFVFLLLVATLLWGCSDKTQLSSGPSPAASLSGLTISGATLSPAFSTDILTYTTSVDHATDSITVTPTATDSNATITVNGVVVPTGSTSPPIPLSVGDNIISIVVTEPDGTTRETYTVTVTRLPSIDAALSALTLSSGSLAPAFDTNVLNYTASVAHATDSITVTPTAHDPDATITVNGVAVTSGTASQAIPLVVGDNSINILVTAQDLTKHTNYVVTVTRAPSADALLSALSLSSGTLVPGFDPNTLNYTATVPYATDSVTVTATLDDPNASLAVDGLPVASGTASQALPLTVGKNTIQVDVTAQDGSTTSPYVITLTREPSDDAALSSLTLSSGSLKPDFKISELDYTASVTHQTDSITVTPTADDPNATITVNGVPVASGAASQAIPLVVGDNTIDILVTAQDLATHANYRVTVNRAPSSDATLSALGLSSGVLTPGFQPGVLNYTADVTNATDTITVTPTATDPNATIMVNGNHVDSGTASQAFPLAVGENTISIEVTAADTTTSTTYVLKVTRAPSSDAALANLTVSTGLLDQKFKPTLLKYTESVIHTVDTITVTPTADDPAATITVNGTALTSGTASQSIPLAVGDTLITILVTAPDGVTTTTYTITVTRAPSSVATLSSLTLSSGVLVPAFQPGTLVYAPAVSNATASITVTPTATDSAATIEVNGQTVASGTASQAIPLVVGVNFIDILVTAQDGSTSTTYSLSVLRPSADATLSDLALFVGGVAVPPNPIFDPNTFNYTASAASSDTEMTVTVTPSSPYYSSITVNGVRVMPGTASQPITLVAGDTPINVVVTAEDGVTTQTYTITVTRPASTDASLSDLSLSSGIAVPINPQFDPATPNYTAKVQYDTLFVKVTPTATDDRATIDVEGQAVVSGDESGEISLSNGVTPINVVVTAEDGTTTETYLIEVLRPWDTVPETLKATLVDPGALFGWSVAIDGDTMVIGAPEDSTAKLSDPQYDNTGAAYVFTRDPGTGDWVQSHVLRPGNLQNGARYGVSVAIQGDRIVVGADSFDLAAGFENGGLAYVFSRTNTTDWQQTGVLASPGSVKNGKFGTSVSIDIDRIVVGALGEESGKGAAHVWAFNSATNLWQHEQTLTASDGATGDTFGAAVVIDESKIAVGAAFHAAGGTRRGAVYVYEPINLVWTETDKLVASNAGDEDWFGASVALDEDTLVAGAPNEDSITEPNSGAVYVFRRDPTNRAWSETQILRGAFLDGAFGFSVAIDNGNMVIGEPGNTPGFYGSAHVFIATISGWKPLGRFPSPVVPGNNFGFAVDIDGDTIVVGQPREDTNGDDSGAAQVYE